MTVLLPENVERSNAWLTQSLEIIWDRYFADVPRANLVVIEYAQRWKRKLGLIRMSTNGRTSYIGINQLLADSRTPSLITTVTIAHELVHYTHGFGSPLPRLYDQPHRGGIVVQEMEKRGMAPLLEEYDQWIYDEWYPFYYAAQDERRGLVPVAASRTAGKAGRPPKSHIVLPEAASRIRLPER